MEIPLDAPVKCRDGLCGRSSYVLVNPLVGDVTHLIVQQGSSNKKVFMVPVKNIAETIGGTIRLRLTSRKLQKMPRFIRTAVVMQEVHQVPEDFAGPSMGWGNAYYMPYTAYESDEPEEVEYFQVPPGELAISRGSRVIAVDGFVGTVDEFVVKRRTGCVTHLVLDGRHIGANGEVLVPLSAVDSASLDSVALNLTKEQLKRLPSVALRRR